MRVGLLHPGEMGAAVGAVLVELGHDVLWCPRGRSSDTERRAAAAGLIGVDDLDRVDVILSVCPPHAALDVARSVHGTPALVIDANAVSPATARRIGELIGDRFVDGAIVGPPPFHEGTRAEWARSQPELDGRWRRAAASAATKGWRWVGEMHEIASTFSGVGLPSGFHEAAAEIFERNAGK